MQYSTASLAVALAALLQHGSCFESMSPASVPSFVRFSPPLQHQQSSSSTQLFLAKTAKKKNKKKSSSGSGSGGLKGFGGIAASSKSSCNVEIDRSSSARPFYECLEHGGAGDTLNRCALGYFRIPIENEDEEDEFKLRGVVALKDVKKGDNLIRIPSELAINLGQEGADPTIPALQFLKQYCEVLGAANKNPEIRAYFEMLPSYGCEDSRGSTDFFSEEALHALQSPLIVEETQKRREQTHARFESGVDDSFPAWIDGTPVTADHLQWAVWLITSRVLTVQGSADEGKSYRLLIPFLDMCNHDRTSTHVLTGRAAPGGELKVVAGEGVKEGEQINICYGGGMAGNDRFIQDYGFLDTSDNARAYTMVAQQIIGKRRIMEGSGAGRLMSDMDMTRTLDQLRSTKMDQDRFLVAETSDPQLRAAIRYRLGVKEALSKFIVMQ